MFHSKTHGAVVIFLGRGLSPLVPYPLHPVASPAEPWWQSAPAHESSHGCQRWTQSTLSHTRTALARADTWSSKWAWTRRETQPWRSLRARECERGHAAHVNKPCGGTSASLSATKHRMSGSCVFWTSVVSSVSNWFYFFFEINSTSFKRIQPAEKERTKPQRSN